jgi:hypothetical protein
MFCLSSSDKSWYEDLLDNGLKSTLTVCPSVEDINSLYQFERISGNIPGAYVTSHFHKLYKVSPFAPKLKF